MTMRTISRTVTFTRPFMLSGLSEPQPAGSYTVETDEEPIGNGPLTAYRRISTLIRLPGRPGSLVLEQVMDVDAAELAAALARDVDGT